MIHRFFRALAACTWNLSEEDADAYSSGKNIKLFTYSELRLATKNFSTSNRIGRGGFGTVYQGTLKNGRQVAVKSLTTESRQGIHEFLTEIDMITNVKHPNLVELVGCCIQGNNRILVYEYMENSSLDRTLFVGTKKKTLNLDWRKRSAICIGTARGLVFLHEELDPYIVHRDIKASNVLLTKNLAPKIGDFGLAKLFPENVTHLSTRVAGTIGYLAPEYAMRGQLTKAADVYSFGVLILEIVSGKSGAKSTWSGTPKYLLEWAWQLYEAGRLLELVDPELGQHYPEEEVIRYMKVAFFCTQAAAKRRPSMTQVIAMLSKQSRLKEELLSPPGIIQNLEEIGTGSPKTTDSVSSQTTPEQSSMLSSSKQNPMSDTDSINPLSSSSVSFTGIVPR